MYIRIFMINVVINVTVFTLFINVTIDFLVTMAT